MSAKVLTLLGFASKAGKLSFGMNDSIASAKRGKAKLFVVSNDLSPKSLKEMTFYKTKYNLPLKVLDEDMQTVSSAVGRKCGIIAVLDAGFAKSISSQEETV